MIETMPDTLVATIDGTITLEDGRKHQFSISTDGRWQQWGAPTSQLGETTEVMETLSTALVENNLIVSDSDTEETES